MKTDKFLYIAVLLTVLVCITAITRFLRSDYAELKDPHTVGEEIALVNSRDTSSCRALYDSTVNQCLYEHPDSSARPKIGLEAFSAIISKNLIYPKNGNEFRVDGKVIVTFIVDERGNLKGKTVIKGYAGVARQLLAIVDGVQWMPAICGGVPVATRYILPMSICVDY